MIWEYFFMASLLGLGSTLLGRTGFRGAAAPALSFVLGTCGYIALGLIQVLCQLPSYPLLTLALVWALIIGCLTADVRRGRLSPTRSGRNTVAVLAALFCLVAALRALNLVTWHTDSFRYAMTSSLIADAHFEEMSTNLLTKRMWGFPALHAPAQLVGEYYFRSLAPLLALATTWTMGWFVMEGLRLSGATKRDQWLLVLAGSALLASNSRFVWNAFYINGHLLCAMSTLVIAGAGWLRARGAAPTASYQLLQNLALPALVTTRPEGALMATLAIIPSVCSSKSSKLERWALLSTLGASTLGWHGYVSYLSWRVNDLDKSSAGMVAWGALLLVAGYVFHASRNLDRWIIYLQPAAEASLWVGLLVSWALRPAIVRSSVLATWKNVALGGASWGSSIVVLTLLVIVTLSCTRSPDRGFLRFPVTTFLPLCLLLAPLRGEAYRVGNWDSLNRMLIHIVPLSIVLVASSATAQWRAPRRRSSRPADAPTASLLEQP